MRIHPLHAVAIAGCLLPAIELGPPPAGAWHAAAGARTTDPIVASFLPGCETRAPITRFFPSQAAPRPSRRGDAAVAVYLAGRDPGRGYTVLGEIEVQARKRGVRFDDLVEHARREARRRGGDALLGVRPRADTATPGAPPAMVATVVGW